MWTATSFPDPVYGPTHNCETFIVQAKAPIASALRTQNEEVSAKILTAMQEGGRPARVALADFCSRKVAALFRKNLLNCDKDGCRFSLEPLDFAGSRRKKQSTFSSSHTPYVFERTDAFSSESEVNLIIRARVTNNSFSGDEKKMEQGMDAKGEVEEATALILANCIDSNDETFAAEAMNFVATVVLQSRLRSKVESMDAVAFISDGSILPRKSGANEAPMASPPAVPSKAPEDSSLSKTLDVDMGNLRYFLSKHPVDASRPNIVSIPGMLIPKGITLVAGGGYHGKSTILRAIASGVYDKIPGDGRETCVTVLDTMSLRAEDGRYVNNCNISAFISNLPTPPGVTSTVDTTHFSSHEASGSTSQASNVAEAIELGAKVFLVDEDVSAANFMARDGRMRALVMDESITPLLYRVNGMYQTLGISCIVVVGGVGDWLDVPDQVILMNKYVASDATKKAASISYQFSYGHVQYAGKGVVHQLEWDKNGTPARRRPSEAFLKLFDPESSTISLLDGGHAISIHPTETDDADVDMEDASEDSITSIYNNDDDGYIDLSRCEQLLGKKPQLYGCGQCVIWLLREAKRNPGVGVKKLLANLDEQIDKNGMLQVFMDNASDKFTLESVRRAPGWVHMLNAAGYAYRPRKYEVGQALTRMRGISMEHLPKEDEDDEAYKLQEAERRKRELQEMWETRRAKKQGL